MADSAAPPPGPGAEAPYPLPRITIQFCTQCKWMLRAAYFAQELLSTFSTALGEVALQPGTGGVFVVSITHALPPTSAAAALAEGAEGAGAAPAPAALQTRVLWDRRADGGFPETKELKRRVRDVVDPARDLGHVDRDHSSRAGAGAGTGAPAPGDQEEPAAPGPGEILSAFKAGQERRRQHPGLGGVLPRAPRPPAESNARVQARLEEAQRRRNDAAAADAAADAGGDGDGSRAGGDKPGEEHCEDCA